MNSFIRNSIITIIAFVLFLILLKTGFIATFTEQVSPSSLRFAVNWLLYGVPVFAALFLMHKPGEIIRSLGLNAGFAKGWLLALVFTLPMLVGFACTSTFNSALTADEFIRKALLAGFFEELIFRGFLFGMLFRYCRWGFVPAVLLGAVLFGAVHLYQGNDMVSALSAFGVTAFGALLFSWVYVEWDYNLWTAIGLHAFMNGAWQLFAVDSSATGGLTSNVFRAASIVLIIAITIIYKKKKFLPFKVNLKTLWVNHEI